MFRVRRKRTARCRNEAAGRAAAPYQTTHIRQLGPVADVVFVGSLFGSVERNESAAGCARLRPSGGLNDESSAKLRTPE
jgi:hypothetical protein